MARPVVSHSIKQHQIKQQQQTAMMTSICVRGLRDTWNSNLRHFPAEKNYRKCNVLMGIVMVLMETIMVYWYVMDSIGGMLNRIGKMPKTHYKKEFCNSFTGKI